MNPGSDKAPYLLPFDHRPSYVDGLFGFKPPLSASQREEVIDSKQFIFEGFRQALAEGAPEEAAAILVDEEFGAHILNDAHPERVNNVVAAIAMRGWPAASSQTAWRHHRPSVSCTNARRPRRANGQATTPGQ